LIHSHIQKPTQKWAKKSDVLIEKIKSKMARISPMEDAENFTSQILDTKKHRDLAKKNGI
jgi:hypothetical protein